LPVLTQCLFLYCYSKNTSEEGKLAEVFKKSARKQSFKITFFYPHTSYKICVHRTGLVLVSSKGIVRRATGIIVTF